MSHLNASIKLIVLIGDVIFLILAIITGIISALISSGRIVALDFPEARQSASVVLLLTMSILGCTIYGCCGVANQIVRKGFCCVGRRMLCGHQFLLLGVFILCLTQQKELSNRDRSIRMVVENVTDYPTFDSFERRLDQYFNKAYFEGNCGIASDDDHRSSDWLMKWIDSNCPITMRRSVCALSKEDKMMNHQCDTTCKEPVWNAETCCPSEDLCLLKKVKESCPYHQCRAAVLQQVQTYIYPTVLGLRFISLLTLLMVIFTCLLICYNPRDDIEIELLKTGVMTEEDVETIRKLKSQRNFSYDKGNGKNGKHHSIIDLDTIHNQNQHQHQKNRTRTRSTSSRIGSLGGGRGLLTQPSKRDGSGVVRLIKNQNGGSRRVYPMEMSSYSP